MSNPTTHVEQFSGSLGGFSGVDPIRYAVGLWLEQATTNLCVRPIAGDGATTGWEGARADLTNPAVDRIRVTRNNATSDFRVITTGATSPAVSAGDIVCFTFEMPGRSDAQAMLARFQWYDGLAGAGSALSTSNPSVTQLPDGRWLGVATAPANAASVRFGLNTIGTGVIGEWFEFRLVQFEIRAYPTSHANYTMGAGYGGSLGNPSTRAASSAAISPSGILSPASGAIAVRTTPTIETGVEEIWGECGVKGSGTDHARWGRDATKHPFVEWSSNDAAYQRLTASETTDALAKQTIIIGHDGTTQYLQVGSGTLQSHARDAVSASWGAGNLTLEASAGGVIYDGFATFDRFPTAKEIATLNSKQNWTRSTLSVGGMSAFQLRPGV